MLEGTTYLLLGNNTPPPQIPLKKAKTEKDTDQHTHGMFSHFISCLKSASQLTTHNLEPTADTGLIRDKIESFESGAFNPNS